MMGGSTTGEEGRRGEAWGGRGGAAAAGGRGAAAAGGGGGGGSCPATDAITMSKAIRAGDSEGMLAPVTRVPPPSAGNLRKEL